MLRAVLFDLDDTLLGNPMDRFLPAYFQALTRYVDDLVEAEHLILALMQATDAMNAHSDRGRTNEEAFASVFYQAVGMDRSALEPAFERFYAEEFPKLRVLTQRRPEARSLIDWITERGLQVAVATNPMFPRVAVEQRLVWAGVPVEEIDYALVTTYENMHATKSHTAYFDEILERLNRRPSECLMIGDSWDMDVLPASSVGIHVYWISTETDLPRSERVLVGHGTLAELWETVKDQGSLMG